MKDIHGIRPPISVGINPMAIQIILLVLACVLLCALLFFLIKKYKKRRPSTDHLKSLPKPLPPYEAAMKALDRLSLDLMNDPRRSYFKLTLILRKYMSGSFKLKAVEMTSEEFIRHIQSMDIDKTIKHQMAEFWHHSDPIKYAGISPGNQSVQKDITIVQNMIKQIEADLLESAQQQEENS